MRVGCTYNTIRYRVGAPDFQIGKTLKSDPQSQAPGLTFCKSRSAELRHVCLSCRSSSMGTGHVPAEGANHVVHIQVTSGPACDRLTSRFFAHPLLRLAMQCGNRTIPETIDALAAEHPDRVWARYFANSNDFDAGVCQSVTFSVLARAIDALAWHLHNLYPDYEQSLTVLYIGPSDIRYFILACAACKCGLKVS
jgi:hypothetical protein